MCHVGIVGLGHTGAKFATPFGRREGAMRLGADETVASTIADEMQKHAGSFNFILNPLGQNTRRCIRRALLRVRSDALVGAPPKPLPASAFAPITGNRTFAGSIIGGINETQGNFRRLGAAAESDIKYRVMIDWRAAKRAVTDFLLYRSIVRCASIAPF